MAIAFVKCTEILSASTNAASGTVSATAGNALIACVTGFGAASTNLVMSGGGTWSTNVVGDVLSPGGSAMGCAFASCLNATGGSATITATFDVGSAAVTAFILEFSGVATVSAYEGKGTETSGTVATNTSPAYTNTGANAVKVAVTVNDALSNTTFTSTGTGWTLPTNGQESSSANLVAACAYKIVSASQADTETWTGSNANNWVAHIAAYLAAAGGTTNTRTATPVTAALQSVLTRTAAPVTVALSLAGQHAVPISDDLVGLWTTQAGGTTNLYQTIDETSPDDADYVQSPPAPNVLTTYAALERQTYGQLEQRDYAGLESVSDWYVARLTSLSTPAAGTRTLRYRYSKDAGTERIDLQVDLYQGATLVQTWTHTDISTTWTQANQSVTGTITDYTDLHIRLTATQV